MKEKSAGAIVFRKEKDKIFYLLLLHSSKSKGTKKDYWDFPKGHLENKESEIEAARREIMEETGLKDIKFIEGFKEKIGYFFRFEGKTIFKTVVFYLAQSNKKEVKISSEHIGYIWLPFNEALEKLIFKNSKKILIKANKFLENKKLIN